MSNAHSLAVVFLLTVSLGCGGGDSPTTPSAIPTPRAVPTPVPTPTTIWGVSGAGDNVFDMPTYIRRVRIDGFYGGRCQNFVVRIAGRLVVNEILGNCSVALGRDFTGTYVTSGGVVEITNASGVQWTFTEVR